MTNIVLTVVTAVATIVVAVATVVYARLAYRQVQLGEGRVLAFVGTNSGRPQVNVANGGATAAYEVSIAIDWPAPPADVAGTESRVESPIYGRLSPEETIHFLSPHDFDITDSTYLQTDYVARVRVSYSAPGSRRRDDEFTIDFGDHVRRMASSHQVP